MTILPLHQYSITVLSPNQIFLLILRLVPDDGKEISNKALNQAIYQIFLEQKLSFCVTASVLGGDSTLVFLVCQINFFFSVTTTEISEIPILLTNRATNRFLTRGKL